MAPLLKGLWNLVVLNLLEFCKIKLRRWRCSRYRHLLLGTKFISSVISAILSTLSRSCSTTPSPVTFCSFLFGAALLDPRLSQLTSTLIATFSAVFKHPYSVVFTFSSVSPPWAAWVCIGTVCWANCYFTFVSQCHHAFFLSKITGFLSVLNSTIDCVNVYAIIIIIIIIIIITIMVISIIVTIIL